MTGLPSCRAIAPTAFDGLFLRLMRIGADESAVGAINRPLHEGIHVFFGIEGDFFTADADCHRRNCAALDDDAM
jgi:hypothetical protein